MDMGQGGAKDNDTQYWVLPAFWDDPKLETSSTLSVLFCFALNPWADKAKPTQGNTKQQSNKAISYTVQERENIATFCF